MILAPEVYDRVVTLVQTLLESGQGVSYEACDEIGVSRDAVFSIYQQAFIRRQKRLTPVVDAMLEDIVEGVKNGKTIYNTAKDLVLDIFSSNASLVSDCALRVDLIRCITEDHMSSHESDQLKRVTGHEYEEVLYKLLRRKHMCFETEEELRKRGKPKTPDVLFLVPMGLVEPGSEGHVVNWIDSKAMFGDADTYADHLDQIKGYCNRYGPGLIIYWNGLVSSLKSNDMVAITDRFPDNWIFPTGEAANGECPRFLRAVTSPVPGASMVCPSVLSTPDRFGNINAQQNVVNNMYPPGDHCIITNKDIIDTVTAWP